MRYRTQHRLQGAGRRLLELNKGVLLPSVAITCSRLTCLAGWLAGCSDMAASVASSVRPSRSVPADYRALS